MKLDDLAPKSVKFVATGLELELRPFTIQDDIKTREICGGQKGVKKAFQEYDFFKITLVAWHQLTFESQKKVVSCVEASEIDPENGEEIAVDLRPIDKFRKLFVGMAQQINLVLNLHRCKGLNIPEIEDEEALKKWVDQMDKVTRELTGH